MPRRVVIHIGFHKTGTSSVQAVLRANRAALKPYAAIRLKPQIKELLHGARGYSTWRDPHSFAKTRRRWGALLDGLPGMPRRVLIVSAEELAGHMPGRGDLMDYGAAVQLAKVYVEGVRSRFPQADLRLHVGLRQPEAWLRSAYWEHVKSSSMVLDFESFADQYAGASDLVGVADAIAGACDVPVSRSWLEDSTSARLGPAQALLAACDLPDALIADLTPAAPQNRRLPDDTLQALLAANRAHSDRAARKAAKQDILARAKTVHPDTLGPEEEA